MSEILGVVAVCFIVSKGLEISIKKLDAHVNKRAHQHRKEKTYGRKEK